MRILLLKAAVLATALLTAMPSIAADKEVNILAYINQTSGCQRPTEAFLQKLDEEYGDRVTLEFIDFGSPKGQKRWREDGMHCMGIKVNGSTKATIVYKGVELDVAFEMPAGHLWLHEELGTAVRQKLEGVADSDRKAPEIKAVKNENAYVITVGDEAILNDLSEATARQMAETMSKTAAEKPLTQDDFTLKATDPGAAFVMRDDVIFSIDQDEVPASEPFEHFVAQKFLQFIKPFPRVSRPFPGLKRPPRRR